MGDTVGGERDDDDDPENRGREHAFSLSDLCGLRGAVGQRLGCGDQSEDGEGAAGRACVALIVGVATDDPLPPIRRCLAGQLLGQTQIVWPRTSTRAEGSPWRLKYQPGCEAPPSLAAVTTIASPSGKNWRTTVRSRPERRPRVVSKRTSTSRGAPSMRAIRESVMAPFVRRMTQMPNGVSHLSRPRCRNRPTRSAGDSPWVCPFSAGLAVGSTAPSAGGRGTCWVGLTSIELTLITSHAGSGRPNAAWVPDHAGQTQARGPRRGAGRTGRRALSGRTRRGRGRNRRKAVARVPRIRGRATRRVSRCPTTWIS